MEKNYSHQKAYDEGFSEGVKYALDYLSDLYEGLDETDLWAEYMGEKVGE